ncbi:MAG: peptidoglycan DD-metalloendopeptidase family protein [Thermodesulfobacteriota bacterium]|nr:peptidoglycan DD-metalloendopeptidase family protein [Thermodesulfobacteriota bacterium]
MRYPYIQYAHNIIIAPLFKNLQGAPLIIDMSKESSIFDNMEVRDQREFQRRLDELMVDTYSWGLSSYLENRQTILSDCPQMVRESRFYHLGLDIIVPLETPLYAPLAATVKESGYEEGEGNYGGYVLLQHDNPGFDTFYSFYGHLQKKSLPGAGRQFAAGDAFALIGDFHENGNWFYHTHLQIITKKGLEQGYLSKGYCTAADLSVMDSLCPDPLSLFRV